MMTLWELVQFVYTYRKLVREYPDSGPDQRFVLFMSRNTDFIGRAPNQWSPGLACFKFVKFIFVVWTTTLLLVFTDDLPTMMEVVYFLFSVCSAIIGIWCAALWSVRFQRLVYEFLHWMTKMEETLSVPSDETHSKSTISRINSENEKQAQISAFMERARSLVLNKVMMIILRWF